MARKTKSVITQRDPLSLLYRAVERYITANGGKVLVIGGVSVRTETGDGSLNFNVSIKCTGYKPNDQNTVIKVIQ